MPATYSVVPTVATGDWITAGWVNTYIGTNLAANWPGTTAGDTEYYVSAVEKARLAKGASGYYLTSNGSIPVWAAFYRYQQALLNAGVALVAGDNAFRFRIPAALNGWNISTVAASRMSGTGVLTIQIRNVTLAVDVLSTRITIDSGETDSSTAAVPAVINTANDGVATGQQIAIDVDDPGTNTFFAFVEIGFLKP
jgi:hypothetical protein